MPSIIKMIYVLKVQRQTNKYFTRGTEFKVTPQETLHSRDGNRQADL